MIGYVAHTSVQEYSLKFKKLSKYAPSLVSNPRDEMNRLVTRVSNNMVEDCLLKILHDNIFMSMVMVHTQPVEETRIKKNNRKFKKAKAYEAGTSKGSIEIQDKHKFKKRVSNKIPSHFTKDKSTNSPSDKLTCVKCG